MTHLVPSHPLTSTFVSAPFPPLDNAHLAVPRRGNVLTTVAEKHGGPLRLAAQHLTTVLTEHDALRQQGALFARFSAAQGPCGLQRPFAQTAAWSLVATWAIAVALRSISPRSSLQEAEEWFGTAGTDASVCSLIPEDAQRCARALMGGSNPEALAQLLPYVLDPHGPGSRLSVMRQAETREARARKRAEGVFYTPADVAEYMAGLVLPSTSKTKPPTLLDLACGTGVFLRAALRRLTPSFPNIAKSDLALAALHGVDVDPTALNSAAFVLLHDCWTQSTATPVELWRSLRANFLWADALTLDAEQDAASCRQPKDAAVPRLSLAVHLPALTGGADVVLGNPPYADIGPRDDFAVLAGLFETVAATPTPKADLYPVFVEQMIRLSAPMTVGSLVLPLSVACNTGTQFVALRRLIARTPGTWRFAFFDRQPHALFGEDVKTRNAIATWGRGPGDTSASVLTGPLRKWRAPERATMLSRISFTPLSLPIVRGIPKVSGRVQAEAFATVSGRTLRLSSIVQAYRRRAPAGSHGQPTVFVGATAYNFLNVSRGVATLVAPEGLAPTSHHPHALDCASKRDADAVLAVLASGIAFWWWHARDDGFHVSRSTLEELPVGVDILAGPDGDALALIGAEIWAAAKDTPVVSNNSGKASFAFPPSRYAAARADADRVLRRALGLSSAFDVELKHFLHDVISAGSGARACEERETES